MSRFRMFFNQHRTFALSIAFLALFSITVTYATPPASDYNASDYNAGETLDPGCAPGAPHCTVAVSGGGSSPWDAVTGGINYAGGNVGIGTTTPGSALDVQGTVTSLGLAINGSASSVTTTTPAVTNTQDSIIYDASYNHIANNYSYKYKVYAYKNVGNSRVYSSAATFSPTVLDDGSARQYGVSVSWDPVAGADGYRVLAYTTDPAERVASAASPSFLDGFMAYADAAPLAGSFDIAGTSFVDDGCGSACPLSGVTVTPTSITGTVNGNTISGGLTLGGRANFDSAIIATGSLGSGDPVPNLGASARMMWIPRAAAFRAGNVDSDQWDSANIGLFSVAMGFDTIASGSNAVAFGFASSASGDNATAFGVDTIASGLYSTAFGSTATALGRSSTAFGESTQANGNFSAAFNFNTVAAGDYSTAFGKGSQANGYDSTVFGDTNIASGESSFATGKNTIASGDFSAAFGQGSIASGFGSFATYGGQALGLGTFAAGFSTATAHSSAAFGGINVGGGDPDHWVATDPLFEIGNGQPGGSSPSDALTVLKNGKVGIGTATPAVLLSVGSSAATSGIIAHFETTAAHCDLDPTTTGGLTCSSDMNLKKNITSLADNSAWSASASALVGSPSVLSKVLALQPVQYNWNTDPTDPFGNVSVPKHDGFIAQDVQKLFPELVTADAKGSQALNYTGLIPYTVEAIREMNFNVTSIDDLTKTNTWRDAIIGWLADSKNGITSIFSKQVTTPTLCVGTNDNRTCITKDQLDRLLQQSGGGTTVTSGPVTGPSDSQSQSPEVAPVVIPDILPSDAQPSGAPADPVQ